VHWWSISREREWNRPGRKKKKKMLSKQEGTDPEKSAKKGQPAAGWGSTSALFTHYAAPSAQKVPAGNRKEGGYTGASKRRGHCKRGGGNNHHEPIRNNKKKHHKQTEKKDDSPRVLQKKKRRKSNEQKGDLPRQGGREEILVTTGRTSKQEKEDL